MNITQKELEMKIIAHICSDEDDMMLLLSEGITEDDFTYSENATEPLFQSLFISARNYFQRFNRLLSQETIENKLKQKDKDIQSSKILSLFVQCMVLEIDHNSFPTLLKELRERRMKLTIRDLLTATNEALANNNPSDVFNNLKDNISQIDTTLTTGINVGPTSKSMRDAYDSIMEEYYDKKNHPEKYKGIDVGLSIIDRATNGFQPSTMNIIVGGSGTGKSVVLVNFAAEVFRRGYNTLFFSLEMPMSQVIARFVARELCIDSNRFYNGKLFPAEEEILKEKLPGILSRSVGDGIIRSAVNDNFFNIFVNFDNPDVDYIEDIVKKHIKMYGKVDAIFVDYLNNMKSKEILQSGGADWAHAGMCASGLRRIAANYQLTAFTAQQINRSGLERGRKKNEENPSEFIANQEDITASQRAFHDADSVIAYNPDKKNHRMFFKLVKGRSFSFDIFAANYYPTMNRIVDEIADDTTVMLSPTAGTANLDHRLVGSMEDSLIEDLNDGDDNDGFEQFDGGFENFGDDF